MSPVKYELDFYIPEDDILRSNCREILRSLIATELLSELICVASNTTDTQVIYTTILRADKGQFQCNVKAIKTL
jgi:hypothetical protein